MARNEGDDLTDSGTQSSVANGGSARDEALSGAGTNDATGGHILAQRWGPENGDTVTQPPSGGPRDEHGAQADDGADTGDSVLCPHAHPASSFA